jgi:hypothetical protein
MRLHPRFAIAAAAVIFSLPGSAAAASADHSGHNPTSHPREVVVSFALTFQSDGSAAGTFTAAGAISDTGAVLAHPVVIPIDATTGTLTGDLTLHGSHGDLTWEFAGTTYPLGTPRAIGRGSARAQSGTSDYLGVHARTSFVVAADFTAGTVSGTFDGTVGG